MRLNVFSAVVACTAFLTLPAMASDVIGLWQTPTKGGQVEISNCGGSLCGKVFSSDEIRADPSVKDVKNPDPKLRTRPIKGMVFLTGFSGGPKEWTGGKIYNAEDGKTYTGSITLDGDTLKLRGCWVAPLCQTQTWTRLR